MIFVGFIDGQLKYCRGYQHFGTDKLLWKISN